MKMLQLDPARRISMKEALRHPYFNDIRPEDIERYRK
jgi:serine/threonine protein kinase